MKTQFKPFRLFFSILLIMALLSGIGCASDHPEESPEIEELQEETKKQEQPAINSQMSNQMLGFGFSASDGGLEPNDGDRFVYDGKIETEYSEFIQEIEPNDAFQYKFLFFADGIPQKFSAGDGEPTYMYSSQAREAERICLPITVSSLRGITAQEGQSVLIGTPKVCFADEGIDWNTPGFFAEAYRVFSVLTREMTLKSFTSEPLNGLKAGFTAKSEEEITEFTGGREWLERNASKVTVEYNGIGLSGTVPAEKIRLSFTGCGLEGVKYRATVFVGEEPVQFDGYDYIDMELSPDGFAEAEAEIDLTGRSGEIIYVFFAPCGDNSVYNRLFGERAFIK